MRSLALPALFLLGACTLGPDYAGPPHPTAAGALPGAFVRAPAGADGATPAAADWWTALGDPLLDDLERQALAANPNVAAALARLNQARAALRLEKANALPTASASSVYGHMELPSIGGNNAKAYDFFNLGFDASWEVDLFGGRRRTVESARATMAAGEARLADVQVQIGAEVAQAYVTLRDRQQRVALLERSASLQEQMLALTRQRYDAGTASAVDVVRLQGQLDATRAQAEPLRADGDAARNALAVLTGQAPGALDAQLGGGGAIPNPPAQVAVGDPAALLRRRPDIRAAERDLAARTAKIGVAEAARFPSLSFMGLIGLGGSSLSDVADIDNIAAVAVPQLRWNFLDFGRGKARVQQAEAARDEAEAQYRATLLSALQDAEDSLSRFGKQRTLLAALARVKLSADHAAALTRQRYRAGTATMIDLLDTERRRVEAEQNLAQAQAGLTNAFVALQKSLGLGWSGAPS